MIRQSSFLTTQQSRLEMCRPTSETKQQQRKADEYQVWLKVVIFRDQIPKLAHWWLIKQIIRTKVTNSLLEYKTNWSITRWRRSKSVPLSPNIETKSSSRNALETVKLMVNITIIVKPKRVNKILVKINNLHHIDPKSPVTFSRYSQVVGLSLVFNLLVN